VEKAVKIVIGAGVPLSPQEVKKAPVFQNWADRLPPNWSRVVVTINGADIWGDSKEIHMLQVTVARKGSKWPAMVTLRSETVDILTIVTDGTKRYVVFVEQVREATGGKVISNAAGGREWGETVDRAAERELWEELGLDSTNIPFSVSLSRLIPQPVLASPGITGELVHMMKAVVSVLPEHFEIFLEELRGKQTGVTAEGEELTLIVQPANRARSFIIGQLEPDGKTVMSLALPVL
jgi:8-oxo-dGTP pyrophosphatase MutT (NUDIX family)